MDLEEGSGVQVTTSEIVSLVLGSLTAISLLAVAQRHVAGASRAAVPVPVRSQNHRR